MKKSVLRLFLLLLSIEELEESFTIKTLTNRIPSKSCDWNRVVVLFLVLLAGVIEALLRAE